MHADGQQALDVIILFRLQHPQSALPLSFLSHTFTVHVTLLIYIYIYKGRKGLGCAQLIDIHSQTHIRSSDAPQKY